MIIIVLTNINKQYVTRHIALKLFNSYNISIKSFLFIEIGVE